MALALLLVDMEEGWISPVWMEFSRNRSRPIEEKKKARKRRRRAKEKVPKQTASLKPEHILCPSSPTLGPEQEHGPNFAIATFIVFACYQHWRGAVDLAMKVLERRSDLT